MKYVYNANQLWHLDRPTRSKRVRWRAAEAGGRGFESHLSYGLTKGSPCESQ
jgi:hypothetical protein